MQNAIPLAKNNLVTFGVKLTRPETGYGYIETNHEIQKHLFSIKQFKEKPNKETAQRFVQNGNFYWNAGIFLFNVGLLIETYKNFESEMLRTVETSLQTGITDGNFLLLVKSFNLPIPIQLIMQF